MARPREFEEEDALERATDLFWCRGYQAVSLDALTTETGVAKQSLYNTFGDKRALFLRCLTHYRERNAVAMRELFGTVRPVRRAFEQLLRSIVDEDDAVKRRGCMMVNAAMELAASDVAIADMVAQNQRALEETFRAALADAQTRGEPISDPVGSARFLVGCIQGLRVMAKTDPGAPALADMVRIALGVLDRHAS